MIKSISAEGKRRSIPSSEVTCHTNIAVCLLIYPYAMSAEKASFGQTIKIFGQSCPDILSRQGAWEDTAFRFVGQSGYGQTLLLPDLKEAALFFVDGDGVLKYFELFCKKISLTLRAFHHKKRKGFLECVSL